MMREPGGNGGRAGNDRQRRNWDCHLRKFQFGRQAFEDDKSYGRSVTVVTVENIGKKKSLIKEDT